MLVLYAFLGTFLRSFLTAVMRVYLVFVLTANDGKIEKFADIKGKRVFEEV